MKLTRIALAASLLMTGGAASAQSAGDAKCIILSNAFAKDAKEANAQKAAEATLYFYLGRVRDGTTAAQLRTLFEAQANSITNDGAGKEMNSCVEAIQTK